MDDPYDFPGNLPFLFHPISQAELPADRLKRQKVKPQIPL
jgi:hypothetical protein